MKYKLVSGKWCSECCFGENHSGIIVCLKHNKQCIPGETVYKEGLSTNGDRIRAMSNEELAAYLNKLRTCPPGYGIWHCTSKNCQQCWLNWLNAEAKTETEGEPSI